MDCVPITPQALFIRDLNAASAAAGAPTSATAGVAVPVGREGTKVQVACWMAAASGTRSFRLRLYGFFPYASDGAAAPAQLTVEQWFMLEDFGTVTDTDVRLDAGNFGKTFQVEVGRAFTRLATIAQAVGGSTPALTTYLGFTG